jgi:hypothetical protein
MGVSVQQHSRKLFQCGLPDSSGIKTLGEYKRKLHYLLKLCIIKKNKTFNQQFLVLQVDVPNDFPWRKCVSGKESSHFCS